MTRPAAILSALLLMALLPATTGNVVADCGPRIGTIEVDGRGFRFNLTYVAEPLVEDGDTLVGLLYVFTGNPAVVEEARLTGFEPIRVEGAETPRLGIDRTLKPPLGFGFFNTTIHAPKGSAGSMLTANISLTLEVRYRDGSAERHPVNASFDLWVLSREGSVPTPVVLGAVASLTGTAMAPILAYLLARGRRRAFKVLLTLLILLLSVMFYRSATGFSTAASGFSGPYVLRYTWLVNGSDTAAGVLYVWSRDGSIMMANVSMAQLDVANVSALPSPIGVPEAPEFSMGGVTLELRGRGSYYYHNGLRKALIYEGPGSEAIYSSSGTLFRLFVRSGNRVVMYVLDASLGYEPPLESKYYAKLFAAPPAVSILVSGLLAYRSARLESRARPGHRG